MPIPKVEVQLGKLSCNSTFCKLDNIITQFRAGERPTIWFAQALCEWNIFCNFWIWTIMTLYICVIFLRQKLEEIINQMSSWMKTVVKSSMRFSCDLILREIDLQRYFIHFQLQWNQKRKLPFSRRLKATAFSDDQNTNLHFSNECVGIKLLPKVISGLYCLVISI